MTNRINTTQDVSTTTPVYVYNDQSFTMPNAIVIEAPEVQKDETATTYRPHILVKRSRRRRRLANRH